MMADKIITQNKTSTSQNRLLTSRIVGDLSASTTCRRQPLYVVISWLKVFRDVKCLDLIWDRVLLGRGKTEPNCKH